MPDTPQPPQQQIPRSTLIGIVGATVAATLVVVLLVVELVTVGTGRPDGGAGPDTAPARAPAAAAPATPPLAPEMRAALDSANAEYRAGRYQTALALYRRVAAAAPGDAAPYFGIYMAATKLGNRAVADSALQVIRQNTSTGGEVLSDSALRALHQGALPKKP
jgi:hypothetical protein